MTRKSASILPENLSPAWRNTILALVGRLFIRLVWSIRSVVNPLLLGYLAAYILHPMVLKLERRGLKRLRAVNVIFLTGFLGTIWSWAACSCRGKRWCATLCRTKTCADKSTRPWSRAAPRFGMRWG